MEDVVAFVTAPPTAYAFSQRPDIVPTLLRGNAELGGRCFQRNGKLVVDLISDSATVEFTS